MGDSSQISVTWAQALGWRLGRHLLDPVGSESVADVVRRLVAVPTMDDGLAELAVRTRRRRSRPGEAAQALADGRLIKAFAFRGAMHYLSPEDGGAYLALRAAGRQWELPSWQEYYQLTAAAWPDFRAAVREALAHGPLTIAELGRAVTRAPAYRHLGPVFDDGAGTLVKPLTWQGDMSFGPPRDGHHTFQRLDTNPRWKGVWDLDDAGPYAVTTYARSYGPATVDGLQHWLGDNLSAGRRRIDRWFAGLVAEGRLVAVDVEGESAYVAREDVDDLAAARPSSAVRLLPGHDQWVMGPGTKDEHVVPADRRTPVTRKANLVIAGGVVAGTWSARGEELTVTWLDPTRPPTAALEEQTTRLADLLDRPLELRLSSVG
jgi:hypothetical protein